MGTVTSPSTPPSTLQKVGAGALGLLLVASGGILLYDQIKHSDNGMSNNMSESAFSVIGISVFITLFFVIRMIMQNNKAGKSVAMGVFILILYGFYAVFVALYKYHFSKQSDIPTWQKNVYIVSVLGLVIIPIVLLCLFHPLLCGRGMSM